MRAEKKIINKIQIATDIIIGLFLGIMVFLDARNIIRLSPVFAFVVFGLILLTHGIFGILKSEISLGIPKTIKYVEGSILGKIVNIIICIAGLLSLVFGILNMIIG